MKTKEELSGLRNEVENLSKKLAELSEDELSQVVGGLFGLLPKDHYENIIMSAENMGKASVETYEK